MCGTQLGGPNSNCPRPAQKHNLNAGNKGCNLVDFKMYAMHLVFPRKYRRYDKKTKQPF